MNTLRHRNGRFARNPVTPEQFRTRVEQIIARDFLSRAAATERAELELRVRLVCDGIHYDTLPTYDARIGL